MSPVVRPVNIEFPEQIDRYWFGNSPFKTHFLNSITLLFPDVEQYIIRNVRQWLKQTSQGEISQDVRAFIAQEAQHAVQHKKFWNNLHQQGYEIAPYLRWLRVLLNMLEKRLSIRLNLAIVAGIEHLTALMAEFALKDNFLAEVQPQLKALFEWHAAEEIEHQSVAYDVFQSATQSYPLRLVGMIVAHILILGFLNFGLAVMLYQDKQLFNAQVWQEMFQFWFTKDKFLAKAFLNSWDYCKKHFHPSQRDSLVLVQKVIS